jgi:hypothetical protein
LTWASKAGWAVRERTADELKRKDEPAVPGVPGVAPIAKPELMYPESTPLKWLFFFKKKPPWRLS